MSIKSDDDAMWMRGSEEMERLLDYLASDQLGYQYTANVARFAHVHPDRALSHLQGMQRGGYVDSMGDGDYQGWKITKDGLVKATANRAAQLS